MRKRVLSLCMALCMTLTLLPTATRANELVDVISDTIEAVPNAVDTADVTAIEQDDELLVELLGNTNEPPNYSTGVQSYEELKSRLEALQSKYVGKYWTTDGKACNSTQRSKYYYGWQCKGFANYIFNDLFCKGYIGSYDGNKYYIPSPNGANEIGRKWNINSSDAKSLLSQAQIGDFIQVRRRGKDYGHTMIVAGVSDSGITIFDCNSDGQCGVRLYAQDWATFASKNIGMSLYHSTAYPTVTKTTATLDVNGYLDGNESGSLEGYGLFDVYFNEVLKPENSNIADYYYAWPVGTTYEIKNIRANNGYSYLGVHSGSLRGTIGAGGVTVSLSFSTSTPTNTVDVPEGTYIIESAQDYMMVDVCGASRDAGANIWLYANNGSSAQKFTLQKAGDGFYYISAVHSGKYWDVSGGDSSNCANVIQYDFHGNSNQKWRFIDSGDGYRYIQSALGTFLDVQNGVMESGNNVWMYEFNGSNAQKFRLIPSVPVEPSWVNEGDYTLVSALDDSKVADIIDADTSEGANLQLWDNLNLDSQKFHVAPVPDSLYYVLTPLHSGLALDVAGAGRASPTNVWQYPINGTQAQKWCFEDAGNGYVYIRSGIGNYLDVNGAGTANGTNIQTYEFNGSAAQKFKLVSTVKAVDITVSFNANGGSGFMSSQSVRTGNSFTLPSCEFASPSGQRFKAWSIDGKEYAPGATYTVPSNANSVVVQAVWEEIPIVRTLSSIEIANKPNKTVYNIGEAWDGAGLSVRAIYSDNSSEVLSDGFNVSGFDSSSAGRKTVIVTYGGKETSFTVDVQSPTTSSLQIVVENKRVSKGGTIDIPVQIKNNPGIAGATLSASYDKSVLTLEGITKGNIFGNGNYAAYPETGVVQWYHTENVAGDGVLFTLQFSVNGNAQNGSYNIAVGLRDGIPANLSNADANIVNAQFISGVLEIESGIPGDVTGDGVVAINDVVKLARAVAGNITLTEAEKAMADVTGDGVIAINDVVKLARYVAGSIAALQSAEAASLSGGASAVIEVATVSGKPGETVRVPVSVTSNPGIAGAQLDILFDSDLMLKNIIQGDVLSAGTFNPDISAGRIQWYYDQANVTNTGVLFTLEFEISANAKNGDAYAVTVNVKDGITANLSDYDFNPVNAEFKAGKVQVGDTSGNAVISTISRNGNTITANVVCADSNASVFCAVYNNSGKMISVRSAQITSESNYQFQFDGQQFDYAKAFIVDSDFRPLCESNRTN